MVNIIKQNLCITFVQRPTLYKCYTNVLCFLRYVSKDNDQTDAGGNSMSHIESIYLNRSRVLGLVPEQIHNKLKISGNVQESTLGLLRNSRWRPRWPPISHFVIYWSQIIIKMSLMSLNICFLGRGIR